MKGFRRGLRSLEKRRKKSGGWFYPIITLAWLGREEKRRHHKIEINPIQFSFDGAFEASTCLSSPTPWSCSLVTHLSFLIFYSLSSSSSSSLFPVISRSSTTVLLFFSKTPLGLVQLLLALCFFIANTNRPNIIFIWSFSTSNYGKSKNCLQWRSRSGGYLLSRNAAAGVPPSPSLRAAFTSRLSTEAFQEDTSSRAYGSDQIQVLEGLDPVRKRPGMYIGSTRLRGL